MNPLKISRLVNRYELAPIYRGETSFTYVVDILEEVGSATPQVSCRVYRKQFFRLQPSTFDLCEADLASYADEELLIEDPRLSFELRFPNENAALEYALKQIDEALSVG